MRILFILLLFFFAQIANTQNDQYIELGSDGAVTLKKEGADFFAKLAINCVHQEYPNKLNQVLQDATMLKSPKELHPAFYGCFDWHSSVHGHWMLIHLLRTYPGLDSEQEIIDKLNISLTAENIVAEINYIQAESKSWERMYGWAWLMKLGEELYKWDDDNAQRWYANLKPLIEVIIEKYEEFLLIQTYPIRTGVHPNTAFGLSFAFDYAITTGQEELEWYIRKAALTYYLDDEDCPASWEPSGEDFLSPCLEEANIMRRVLDPKSFNKWFEDFLDKKELKSLLIPANVSDRSDPKIVHLDGLNLSRATCFFGIANNSFNEKLREQMITSANEHLKATLPNIASEHYEGTHWLGTFAVYALSAR
ncbi:DUF2891 domain-containing protein [Portibacter lacus]|uniref:DUF2891 domain-containing protein n=1 Tax=Portibacter lacus TaxID=1099794 RepID=A0AA37WFI5_9BACT|nr:DUF2891 domain-containing protein [Portibacter lacus]GLR18898.1 hypothetical protein GCM10007940_35140 [Portibacter lacus]